MEAQVMIVGAGPTGLMLAGELGLAGVQAIVLEQATQPTDLPKANGLVGHIVRVFDARGLLDGAPDLRPVSPPGFPFGPISLEIHRLPDNPLHVLPIPQHRLEKLLTSRAIELGASIVRGAEVVGIDVTPDAVAVRVRTAAGTDRLNAEYLVGCDGARSFVRHHAGIGFPGITSDETSRIGRVVLPPAAIEIAGDVLIVRDGPRLNMFRPNRTPTGAITIAPAAALDPTVNRDVFLISTKEQRQPQDADGDLTAEELQASIQRVLGIGLPIERAEWRRATVANSRQAEAYRSGRLFLAGDAAHIFSAGGSALNVGLLDAVNLGWKLAAVVQGTAAPELLDTYQTERHPAGAQALAQTRAQAALAAPGENATAVKDLLTDLLRSPEPLRRVAEIMEGAAPDWAPDIRVSEPIRRTIAAAMRSGRALLIDGSDDHVFTTIAEPWGDRVELIAIDDGPTGMLIRPDGYLAWDADEATQGSTNTLTESLIRWFGPAHPPRR
jgi:2-polyprenyl-6-methoxyphenol hydroxylase-like FAD-dependent oxidoreductase